MTESESKSELGEINSNIKSAQTWNLSPFTIDDDGGGDYTWSQAVLEDWCSGSGTWIDPYVIENITINALGSGDCLVVKDSTVYFIIRDSKFYNSGSSGFDAAIQLINVDNGKLINNNCTNNFRGIYLRSGSSNNTIIQNILSNTGRDGLYFSYSNDNFVIENYVNNNSRHGMVFSHSSNNVIIGNEANYNNYGIHLDWCPNNTILGNIVKSNGDSGIMLSGSNTNNNNITMNTLELNSIAGITILTSTMGNTNNIIYNNTFVNNVLNAQDETTNNYWDYNSFGNYWSDYGGVDADDDGIGDTPYVSGNIFDSYPIWDDVPNIYLISPSPNELFDDDAPNFAIRISDPYLDTMWYTMDDGFTNIPFTVNGTIDQNNWSAQADGPITIIFYANDTHGHINSTQVIIYKDDTIPNINIISPLPDQAFGAIAPNFNIEIQDSNLDSIWYSIDSGFTNITFTENGTIDQNNWTTQVDGLVTLVFYANDTLGHINSAQVIVKKDTKIPIIDIILPNLDQLFGESSPSFNVEVHDLNLDTMWYTIDGGLTNITFTTNDTIDQISWIAHLDGMVTITFYVNDTSGHINSAQVIVKKDTTIPTINIISPTPAQLFSTISPDFILEAHDLNLDTMWYTIDGGLTNFTFTTNETIDQSSWTAHLDGPITITFYANDTLGHINSVQVIINKDTTIPMINIISPTPNQLLGTNAPNFIVEITGNNLDTFWYSINNGMDNFSFTVNCTINQAIWNQMPNGTVTIKFYANNTLGKITFQEVTVRKDIENPIISILTPTMNEIFEFTPAYEISLSEVNLDKIWYTIDRGTNKVFFTELIGIIDQTLWNQLPNGYVIIRFYTNDTVGNTSFDEIIVVKDVPTPIPQPGIPGYNVFILLGIISLITIFIINKRFTKELDQPK